MSSAATAITIGAATPTIVTPTATSVGVNKVTLGATVSNGGGTVLSSRGTCFSTVSGQATLVSGACVSDGGTTVAVFSHARTGLSAGTTYYYQGYATNSAGTSYSGQGSFTTQTAPSLDSPTSVSIGSRTATLGANLTSPSFTVTARGICWGMSPSPTTNCSSSGATAGVYTQSVAGLPLMTLVYYRGYVTYTDGAGTTATIYSTDGNFTTVVETQLGSGTDPISTTIAPGSPATMAGAFSFLTSQSGDTISSVVVNLGSVSNASGIFLLEITSDDGNTIYGSVTNPTTATVSVPLNAKVLTASENFTQYKIRITPKSHANMSAVPGAAYTINAKVDSWVGTNTAGGVDTGGTTLIIDNLSPSATTNTTASIGNQQATIAYSTPADADIHSVLVLRSTSAVAATPTEGASYSVGNTIGASAVACVDTAVTPSDTGLCSATGLANGTAYHFKVFVKDSRGNYSTGVVPTGSPITPAYSATTVEQSGYRFFASSTQSVPGTALASQNTAAVLTETSDAFRLRLTFHVGSLGLDLKGKSMKLQYAQRAGTCDTAFVGESYSDITSSTPISYYNTPGITNNSPLGSQADITHDVDTIVNQSYVESNPFTNSISTIAAGQDGKFDFSLYGNGAASKASYCIRAVNADGGLLNSYSVIPELVLPVQNVELTSYRMRKDDGTDTTATFFSLENSTPSTSFVVGDKVRIRFVVTNIGSVSTMKSYQLEYSTSTCTAWTKVPRVVDATTEEWKMETSPYVADNTSTTKSSSLTSPSGKTFTPGKVQTFNSVTEPITLQVGQFTEIEYAVRSTITSKSSVQNCFRVSAVGDPALFTYPVTPYITPVSRVFRYEGGGGGGGSQSTIADIEAPAANSGTTVTGGGTDGSVADPVESIAPPAGQTSTSSPAVDGGSGDVGYFSNPNIYASYLGSSSRGMVLGESAENMCVDMKNRMLFGSRDTFTNGEVSQLQYFLKMRGLFNVNVTGYFGELTRNAVRKFQADNNLIVTGIAGKVTRNTMSQLGCVGGE